MGAMNRMIFQVDNQLLCFLISATHNKNKIWALPDWPEMPADANVLSVHPRWENDSLDFIVESSTFPPTVAGAQLRITRIPNSFGNMRTMKNPFLKKKAVN